jgi:hypothetical protein
MFTCHRQVTVSLTVFGYLGVLGYLSEQLGLSSREWKASPSG